MTEHIATIKRRLRVATSFPVIGMRFVAQSPVPSASNVVHRQNEGLSHFGPNVWPTINRRHDLIRWSLGMTNTLPVECPICHGRGLRYLPFDAAPAMTAPKTHEEACRSCDGTGKLEQETRP